MKWFKLAALIVLESLAIIALLSVLGVLDWAAHRGCSAYGRQAATANRIMNLSEAAKMYESDCNQYPAGDGRGSATLVSALKSAGPRKLSYFEFTPDMIDPETGNLRNLLRPDEFTYYRNNSVRWPGNTRDPDVHNRQSFDIWARDCDGRFDGVNNWE